MFAWMYGSKADPTKLLRENKRALERSLRSLERETQALRNHERLTVVAIQRAAREGKMADVEVQAKELVRTRRMNTKFEKLKSHTRGVMLKVQTIKTTQAMGETAMRECATAIAAINKNLNTPQIAGVMQEFEKETQKLEMAQELMEDSIEDVMEESDEEAEQAEVVEQVLEELGIQMQNTLPKSSASAEGKGETAKGEADTFDLELQMRLDALRLGGNGTQSE